MESKQDYHIQVDVRGPAQSSDFQARMIKSWAMALHKIDIPFTFASARMQTHMIGQRGEYHQLIYGVSDTVMPDARRLRSALQESLVIHDLPDMPIDVFVYIIQREVVSSDVDTTGVVQRGVMSA